MNDLFPGGDPLETLRTRLKRLHREAGEPSTRDIARRTGNRITHGTVATLLRCAAAPRWESLELLVRALYGDLEEFKALWMAVRERGDTRPAEIAVTATDYFCYISQSKVERLHAANVQTGHRSAPIEALFEKSTFGRPHLLHGGSLNRPLLVSRLRSVMHTLASRGEIAELEGADPFTTSYLHHTGAFTVPGYPGEPSEADPATAVLRIAGITRPDLRLDCSMRYFSEAVDGRYVVSSELNAFVYGRSPMYFDTVFVLVHRGAGEILGSPLYLKLYTAGTDIAL